MRRVNPYWFLDFRNRPGLVSARLPPRQAAMSLRDSLDRWSSRNSIRGAAVVNEDGLLVHDALTAGVDAEAIAALSVTVARNGRQLGTSAGAGRLGSIVLEFDYGPTIVTPLDDRHTLVVFAEPDQDLGPLLFEVRREKAALSRGL